MLVEFPAVMKSWEFMVCSLTEETVNNILYSSSHLFTYQMDMTSGAALEAVSLDY